MEVKGRSEWFGAFKEGHGTISTTTDTLRDAAYSYASRFEGAEGAIPEELLATGHAGCFNHALANIAGQNGVTVESLETVVELTMGTDDHGPSIDAVHISVDAVIPGIDEQKFNEMADGARKWCAFSKALSVPITLEADLGAA